MQKYITVHYCPTDYDQQFAAIDQVRCRKMLSCFILQNSSTQPCNKLIRQLKNEELGWELLQHLPYSPDLVPNNCHLFEPQSESLEDIKFKNDEDVLQHCVRKFLQVLTKKT